VTEADGVGLLRTVEAGVRTLAPRRDLLSDDDVPTEAYLILDGWGMRYKELAEGRRQILAFLLPGDLCLNPANHPLGHCVGALTAMRYSAIPLPHLESMMAGSPELIGLVLRKQLAASAVHLEWIANSGRPAYEATAHLLCEIYTRAKAAGLADARSCDFPPTQFDLACALGLTAVHVNRMLQQLRRDGLIELRAKRLAVVNEKGLSAAAQFDRDYLDLPRRT
jgi:CRP-like cAMP-binding protein